MSESIVGELVKDPTRKPIEIGGVRVLGYKNKAELRAEIVDSRKKAETDSLTNLKRKEELPKFLDEKLSSDAPATMLFIDIDRFKDVNDQHQDHSFGDSFLEVVGRRLSHMFPQDDNTFVCRFGGEEFVVVMTGGSNFLATEVGLARAEQFRQEMERNPVTIGGETLRKTVSIGVAARGRGESSTDWIKRADSAMYAAKDGGRNRTNVSVM